MSENTEYVWVMLSHILLPAPAAPQPLTDDSDGGFTLNITIP